MVDSSFTLTRVQGNSKDENDAIKNGDTPEAWTENKATVKILLSALI